MNLTMKPRMLVHAAVKGLQDLYEQLLEALPALNSNRRLSQAVHPAQKINQVWEVISR